MYKYNLLQADQVVTEVSVHKAVSVGKKGKMGVHLGDDDNRAYSQGLRKTTEPTVVLQCSIRHGAFPSVQGGRMVLYVQDSSIQRVWVWGCASMTEALDRSTLWLQEKTCSNKAEATDSRLP